MLKRPSISVYLISMNMLLLGLLFPSFSALFLREMVHLRDTQLERNITTIRQSLATRSTSLVRSTALSAQEAIAGYDFTFLQNLLQEVTRDDSEINSCMILDQELTIIAHSDFTLIGSRLTEAALQATKFSDTLPPSTPQVQLFWPETNAASGKARAMEAVYPLYSGNELWGIIHCGYALATTDQQIAEAREEWARQLRQMKGYFFILLAAFLVVGFIIVVFLTRSFVRATQVLHDGVKQVADGTLEREISLPGGIVCEEFAGLVTSFNTMTEKLRLSHRQLDDYSKSLEEKVVERTKALQEAQKVLVKQAHEAGLAEMAVGVLHNIGNAITPAQIGTIALEHHLTDSRLRSRLGPSLTPLQDYLEGKRTLSDQEKQRLAQIVEHLPQGINEEFEWAIKALKGINAKHRHIENIIKLQMRYAKVMDNASLVNLNRLAQDALDILDDAISKRQIRLTISLQETPLVRTEAAKLLQVMVNLIKNGYEAMDNCASERRELTISTGLRDGDPGFVLFSVQDTGNGFTEEEKGKLFAYGYTSKERGSGFGLHSCSNFVIANHGRIEAVSAGPGLGAKFTVLLPADARPAKTAF